MHYKVKGKKYKLVYKKMPSLHGECDKDKKIIYIDDSKDTEKIACRVHAHELAHAYFKELMLDSVIDSNIEEMLCNLCEELVDNHIDQLHMIKYGSES